MKNRIQILDGFRALSIFSVLFFHFFSRWTPPLSTESYYPYGSKYYSWFQYGGVGVEFFFMISGFVIYFTLENTETFKTFWIKRFIRLFPAMLFASILTYALTCAFDRGFLFWQSHQLRNFIASLTFISPSVFQLFHINVSYLNGSYWSLWPEVEFYAFSSVLYFLNRKNFFRNFILASACLIIAHPFLFKNEDFSSLGLLTFLPFFAMGSVFYQLWKTVQEKKKPTMLHYIGLIFFAVYMLLSADVLVLRLIYALMIALFLLFIYAPRFLGPLNYPVITRIGTSSYFLYLIHQNIGVLAIHKLGPYFGAASVVCPLLVIVGLIVFSNWFTERVEKKYSGVLKSLLLKRAPKREPAPKGVPAVVGDERG